MPAPAELLQHFDAQYCLGAPQMDQTHREFLECCVTTAQSRGSVFAENFRMLFEHTRQHFAEEERWMQETGYPALAEHRANHQRTLGDMDRFCQRARAGRLAMAQAWLNDSLMEWFDLHARTMDSALAAWLKQQGVTQGMS